MRLKLLLLVSLLGNTLPAQGQSDWCRSLYLRKCASCHASDGSGHSFLGEKLQIKDLRPKVKQFSDEQISELVLHGKGKMPANRRFSREQVEGLTVYLRALAADAPYATAVCAEPVARTETLYGVHCSSCHGRDGTGRGDAPSLLSLTAQSASDQELSETISNGRGKMHGYGNVLIPAQIADLVKYVRTLAGNTNQQRQSVQAINTKIQDAQGAPSAPAASSLATTASTLPQSADEVSSGVVPATTSPPPVEEKSTAVEKSTLPDKRFFDVQRAYARKCSSCHSRDGSGTGIVGRQMKIRSFSSAETKALSDEQLAAVISNGRGQMPAFIKKLSSAEISQLVAYIRGFGATDRR